MKKVHNTGIRMKDQQLYPCNTCLLKFVGKTAYRAHLFSHKIEKQGEVFTCRDCSHLTSNEEDMMKHQNSHHFKLVYKCYLCKVTFGRLDSFRVHLVSKHEDSKDDLHKCERCQYATRRKDAMIRHMKQTHEKVKNYCEFCDYKILQICGYKKPKGPCRKETPRKAEYFSSKVCQVSKTQK